MENEENNPAEFPDQFYCRQCRRPYPVRMCRATVNVLLTETKIACPRCRRRLHVMKLKDWYDHYVEEGNKEIVENAKNTF